jgi:hypothetical protein
MSGIIIRVVVSVYLLELPAPLTKVLLGEGRRFDKAHFPTAQGHGKHPTVD